MGPHPPISTFDLTGTLGLARRAVRLSPHDPEWGRRFRAVARRIAEATGLPHERIQHVGSTAVVGLPAKPVLDIDVGLASSDDVEEVAARLTEAGFVDRGDGERGIGRLLVLESAPHVRTVHVHVIAHGSVWWQCDLAFRDALRTRPELRSNYARVKAKLAERFPSDRKAYREGKAPFIQRVLYDLDPTGWRARRRGSPPGQGRPETLA